MKSQLSCNKTTLQKLKNISTAMLKHAEQGDWDAVLSYDNKRLKVLRDYPGEIEPSDSTALQHLKNEIIGLDDSIKKLALDERKAAMKKELQQRAQLAAQSGYKQALASGTGL
ncbi:MAG: flagellar protein FliT [Gammaproteobacteria bacterium]|nr:flagellar protein FliT [Gammaproteobacteria bacterium]